MNVLVVDDDQAVRQMLRTVIRHRRPECEVIGEAADGLEALEKVRLLRPEIVVMDDKMPNMDGAEATRIIIHDFPTIRVVGYSASLHAVRELKLAGAVAATSKDDVDELLRILDCGEPGDAPAL